MCSNYCGAEIFVYFDKIIFLAIYRSGTIEFARSMYEFNVINKDTYETMTEVCKVLGDTQDPYFYAGLVLTDVLMEVFKNPIGYNIFKESLKKKNSLKILYHQINLVG